HDPARVRSAQPLSGGAHRARDGARRPRVPRRPQRPAHDLVRRPRVAGGTHRGSARDAWRHTRRPRDARHPAVGAGHADRAPICTTLPVFAARSRSVAELIGRATARGDRAFLAGHNDPLTISFADLESRAARIAAVLATRGVTPGDRVMLVTRLSVPGMLTAL